MNTLLIQTGILLCCFNVGVASPLDRTTTAIPSHSHSEHPKATEVLRKFIPPALRTLAPGKTTLTEVLKQLGEPAEKSKIQASSGESVWQYDLSGIRFDTAIHVSDRTGKVIRYRFLLGAQAPSLEEVRALFSKHEWEVALSESKKRIAQNPENPPLELHFPNSKLNLVFKNYSPHFLQMIEFH